MLRRFVGYWLSVLSGAIGLVQMAVADTGIHTDVTWPEIWNQHQLAAIVFFILFVSILALLLLLVVRNRQLLEQQHLAEISLKHKQRGDELQKISRAVEQSYSMVVITDQHAIIEFVNPAFTSITGYSVEEVLGDNSRLLQSGNMDADYYRKMWSTLVKDGQWQGELHNKRKDGSLYWERAVISSVRDESGEITHYVAVAEDITARKAVEQALKENEERFDTAMSVVKEGIWDWHLDSNEKFFDARCYTMAGYSPDEFPGNMREWKKRIHPDDLQLAMGAAEQHIIGKQEKYDVRFRLLRKDGNYMWIRARGRIVSWSEQGEPLRIVGTHADITEQKLTELALAEGERKYQGLVNDIGEGFVIYSHDGLTGKVTFVSDGVASVFGISKDEPLGKTWAESIDWNPEDIALAEQGIAKFYSNASDFAQVDMRFNHPDGTEHTIHVSSHPARDSTGAIVSVDGIVQDITERKLANEQLRLAASVFEHSRECIVIADAEHRIIDATVACVQVTGYSRQDLVGNKSEMLSSNMLGDSNYEQMWAKLNQGQVWRSTFQNRHKNGHLYWEECSISPVKNTAAETTHYVAIKRDVSQREAYVDALRNAKQEAQAANQAKSDFLANISHEIRTPMNAILGFAELSMVDGMEPKYKSYLENIQASVQTMLALVNDLLDFSKIEAGKLQLESIPFDLHEMLEFVVSMTQDEAHKKGLQLQSNIFSSGIPLLFGDPLRFKQVLINLIGNAVKFSQEGCISVDARVLKHDEKEVNLEVTVCDSGIGIRREQQKNLFQAFTQADSSTTRKYGGTGLGLSISKELVGMMGGELKVESEPGIGSTFYFKIVLPVASGQSQPARKQQIFSQVIHHSTVLVVDDDALNQQVVAGLLERHGVIVEVASSGTAAIAMLDSSKYDLLLMDIQMPVMDGYESSRKIRKLGFNMPIIALTANAMPSVREKCLYAGMNDYITKPINSQFLLHKIGALLENDRVKVQGLDLPGIDVDAAMERLGIDIDEYMDLLEKFIASQADSMANVQTALDRGEQEAATRIAHTLAGLAGTIGATVLYRLSRELEQELCHHHDFFSTVTEELGALMHSTRAELEQVVSVVSRVN